ncbi:MAG: hydroxyacid dehydrogenase [Xanthobacteraceae bacterium]|nr:hydroxyacid dehydrogenase [Xanthobacteraceae bacterium]
MPRILVTSIAFAETLARLREFGEVDANDSMEPFDYAEAKARAGTADAILAFMPDRVDAPFIAAAPKLKIVACALKGFDNFDLAAAARAGVWVSAVPDLLTNPTAELAVGLAIALARKIGEGDEIVRDNRFQGWRPVLYGTGLHGSTVAIVGMGAVGQAIARRLSGFGCRLLGVDPSAEMPGNVSAATLQEALEQSDYVFSAVPLSAGSRHLIGADAIARMKAEALLINIGRGSVISETAVADALERGALGGYAADVFEFEDWALPDRPREVEPRLLAHASTLFTPHLGSAVAAVRREIELAAAENIGDVLCGRAPRHAINSPPAVRKLAS